MKFIIRNNANIANKYIRFAKWKIRKLSGKFSQLIYSEIYINKLSHTRSMYVVTVKLGVAGKDIVVSHKSDNLKELWSVLSMKIKRQLRKYNAKKRSYRAA